jgi:hypothetical protein
MLFLGVLVLSSGATATPNEAGDSSWQGLPSDTLETRPDTLRLPPADTTEVPRADTLGIPPVTLELPAVDSTAADAEAAPPRPPSTGPPVGFLAPPPGLSPDSLKPARRAAFEAKDLLREVPGSFTYDLGGFGWPHGWTPDGQPPEAVRLTLSDVPFNDLITGRPRFDLLMLPLLEPLSVTSGRLSAATTVQAHFRDLEAPEPLTELQYMTGGTGLQSITALHTQERDLSLPGAREEGRLSVLFGYGGHAADNEYRNARLERMRQTLGRVRLAQRTWSLELRNLHNRRSRGAHGGVVPARYPARGKRGAFRCCLAMEGTRRTTSTVTRAWSGCGRRWAACAWRSARGRWSCATCTIAARAAPTVA